jgi:hypothetical protein
MINGAHFIIYSTSHDADRNFLREVIGLPHVDVGHGWLIFGLPRSEVAVHPSDKNGAHALYFMCDDIEAFVMEMRTRHVKCGPVVSQGWGLLTQLTLPGGGTLGVYEPRHARPEPMIVGGPAGKTAERIVKKTASPVARKGVRKAAATRSR